MQIILLGASGRMGRVVAAAALQQGHGTAAGVALEEEKGGAFPIYRTLQEVTEPADVVLDFSSPALLNDALAFATGHQLPLVIAATGHSDSDVAAMEKAAAHIALLRSGNMSLGIALMRRLIRQVHQALPSFDIEIVEKHHRMKKDAPSGTALMLFDDLKAVDPSLHSVLGRSGIGPGRDSKEVGIHAIRGGTLVGEHSVQFVGQNEMLEIRHESYSREIFALGALTACHFVLGKAPGMYTMDDVFA